MNSDEERTESSDEEDELDSDTSLKIPKGAKKGVKPQPPIELIRFRDYAHVAKIPEREHLTNDNWYNWKERMARVFRTCAIMKYLSGVVVCPDRKTDRQGARN